MSMDVGGGFGNMKIPGNLSQPGGLEPSAAPKGSDVAKLEEAMEAAANRLAPPPDATVQAEVPAAAAAETAPPPGPLSVGDRILGGITSLSDQVQAGRAEAVEVLGKQNVTQADLLKANFAMIESSTLVTAASKTAEKITQGIKNLQQG